MNPIISRFVAEIVADIVIRAIWLNVGNRHHWFKGMFAVDVDHHLLLDFAANINLLALEVGQRRCSEQAELDIVLLNVKGNIQNRVRLKNVNTC